MLVWKKHRKILELSQNVKLQKKTSHSVRAIPSSWEISSLMLPKTPSPHKLPVWDWTNTVAWRWINSLCAMGAARHSASFFSGFLSIARLITRITQRRCGAHIPTSGAAPCWYPRSAVPSHRQVPSSHNINTLPYSLIEIIQKGCLKIVFRYLK